MTYVVLILLGMILGAVGLMFAIAMLSSDKSAFWGTEEDDDGDEE